MKHLVFYDGSCGLCDHIVIWLLKKDKEKLFAFAPLQGETAKKHLSDMPENVQRADSLILVENYQTDEKNIYIFGKAAFRILWLLGGAWKLLGWACFLPGIFYNFAYRLIASNRHRLFAKRCLIPKDEYKDRFLI